MERQALKLEESVAVAERAATAAQTSADAATANIDLVINKERARVRVEIGELKVLSSEDPIPAIVTRASSLPDAKPAIAVPGQYPLTKKPRPNSAPPATCC